MNFMNFLTFQKSIEILIYLQEMIKNNWGGDLQMETLRMLISENREIALIMLMIYVLGVIFKITKVILKERKNK